MRGEEPLHVLQRPLEVLQRVPGGRQVHAAHGDARPACTQDGHHSMLGVGHRPDPAGPPVVHDERRVARLLR
eukprot:2616158-Lingulodinium_polyedra.AAC.1